MKKRAAVTAIQPMDTPHYTYFQALYMAFYSMPLYLDAAKRWQGWSLLYVVLIATCISLPFAPRIMQQAKEQLQSQTIQPITQLPPLFFSHGTLLFNQPMPYLIYNDKQRVVVVIDTTGKVTPSKSQQYPDVIWIFNQHSLHYHILIPEGLQHAGVKTLEREWLSKSFDEELSGFIDPGYWFKQHHIAHAEMLSMWLAYPVVLALLTIQLMVFLLVSSSIGRVFARVVMRHVMSFRASFRVMMLATTPSLALLTVFAGLNQFNNGVALMLLMLMVGYYMSAILAIKRSSQSLVLH